MDFRFDANDVVRASSTVAVLLAVLLAVGTADGAAHVGTEPNARTGTAAVPRADKEGE